jgi:hypothetical protein
MGICVVPLLSRYRCGQNTSIQRRGLVREEILSGAINAALDEEFSVPAFEMRS